MLECDEAKTTGPESVDILWVIDNSASMCQEQELLRASIQGFLEELSSASLDFHLGVTTTHYPSSGLTYTDPVADPAHLQSTPQPLPGRDQSCREGVGVYDPNVVDQKVETVETRHLPIQQSLAVARSCLADPSKSHMFIWTDDQISCALEGNQQGNECMADATIPDRDGSGRADLDDLFPPFSDYKSIPKVLRSKDYLQADGSLNLRELRQDFMCISTVGTRGYGIEKGIRAAVDALSVENTGGVPGGAGADASAPNHGLIRKDARFSLVFFSDENDCSHDGNINEGNLSQPQESCLMTSVCDYENSTAVTNSRLTSVAMLAQELRSNLAKTKGVPTLPEASFTIASIVGTSKRFDTPVPQCSTLPPEELPVLSDACVTMLGKVGSGDRYERFMRQFEHFYPNGNGQITPDNRLDETVTLPLGAMCNPIGFGSEIREIGRFFGSTPDPCKQK